MFVTARQLKQEGIIYIIRKFSWSLWTRKPFSEGHKFLVEENKKFSTQSNSIVSKQRSNVTMWSVYTSKYIMGYHAVSLGFIGADKSPLPSWSYQSIFPNWVNANSEIFFLSFLCQCSFKSQCYLAYSFFSWPFFFFFCYLYIEQLKVDVRWDSLTVFCRYTVGCYSLSFVAFIIL